MENRTNSSSFETQSYGNKEEGGRSITDLPSCITENIISRLSVKRIFNCMGVCKYWSSTISSAEFANVHFERADSKSSCPLVLTNDHKFVSRTLYLVEPEDEKGFNVGDCSCQLGDTGSDSHVHMKLETQFKLPLRDSERILVNRYDTDEGFVNLIPKYHKFKVLNSCNGLLCLCEPLQNNPAAVCNPVTGELIELPKNKNTGNPGLIVSGFGYSPKTGQYKIIRVSAGRAAEIHALGTGSWISVGNAPCYPHELKFPTYLNGAIHWLRVGYDNLDLIVTFDIEKEKFQLIPYPQRNHRIDNHSDSMNNISMGVLRGCLYICDASQFDHIDLWVMKIYGVKESWTKDLTFSTKNFGWWQHRVYQPIKYLENGAILMFCSSNCLIYYDPSKAGCKYLKLRGIGSNFEAIAYVPSFIQLKDSISGCSVEVLNVKSRCGKLKLKEEAEALCLLEENKETALPDILDSKSWSYNEEYEEYIQMIM